MTILDINLYKNHIQFIFILLNDMEYKVIRLKHGFETNEKSYTQIGDILDISKQSAYQYYKQGINRIRILLS